MLQLVISCLHTGKMLKFWLLYFSKEMKVAASCLQKADKIPERKIAAPNTHLYILLSSSFFSAAS